MNLDAKQLTDFLNKKIKQLGELETLDVEAEEFKQWKSALTLVLIKAFGEDSAEVKGFEDVSFYPTVYSWGGDDSAVMRQAFLEGIKEARGYLKALLEVLETWGYEPK